MLKIYGVPFSTHTRKIIVAALEKRIPYELVPVVPLAPPHDWLKLSPLGLIPAIEDDSTRLADSTVIAQYLDRKYPANPIYPTEAAAYGRALWIEEFVDGGLSQHVLRGVLFQRVFAPRFLKQPPDEALIAKSLSELIPPKLEYLEDALTGDFFVDDAFSMADIAVASILMNFHYAGEAIRESQHPRLHRFLRRVLRRPSFVVALQSEIPAAESLDALDMTLVKEVTR